MVRKLMRGSLSLVTIVGFWILIPAAPQDVPKRPHFTDVAPRSSFSYLSKNGFTGRKYFIEPLCGGVAILDYDNDGLMDIYFTNGATLPELKKSDASFHNVLLRNKGGGIFDDVSRGADLAGQGLSYSLGAAAGDYDNDGWTDLFVASAGTNTLYHNNGDGTFADVTAGSGLGIKPPGTLSVQGAWLDYDNDGLLDLVLSNYTLWTPATDRRCVRPDGVDFYCHPATYSSVSHGLYRNRGGGKLTDVTQTAGLFKPPGKLMLNLIGGKSNRDAIGARIKVTTASGRTLFNHGIVLLLLTIASLAQVDLREAARLDQEGKCAESEKLYQKALAAGSPSVSLLNNVGNHYLLCSQPEEAKVSFEQLLKSSPDHTNANLQLANIAVEQKQQAKALAHLARVEKQAAGNPQLYSVLGVALARLGQYDRAEAAFHAVVQARPGDFDALMNLGRSAARAGHHDRGRRALDTALKIRPDDPNTLLELGLLHASLKDFSRSVFLLAQARQKAPRRPDILLALARAAEDAGYYGDSALAYDDYVAMRPDDEIARRDRARVLGYTGTRLEEGLKEMAAYVARRPEDPVGHYNLAQFTWREQPERSLEQLATAVRLNPKFAPAHVSRAWLLHRIGRVEEAVPHLEAALKVTPDDIRALDLLGLVYLSLEQPAKAEAPLRRAITVAPEDPAALLHLAQALMALGRDAEAQTFTEKYQRVRPRRQRDPRREPGMIEAATLPAAERRMREIERHRAISRSRPDDPLLHANLASLLLADGRVEEGVSEFRQLLSLNADAAIYEQAGRSLLQVDEYQLAQTFLERASADRPGARLDLAIAMLHTGGPERALKVIEDVPPVENAGDFLLLKARLLDAAGRQAEAHKVLTEGMTQSALRPQVVQQASLLLARFGRYREASDLVGRAIVATPGSSELHFARAILLALTGSHAAAIQSLREIETRWPEWDRPYIADGLLLERQGSPKDAAQKLRTAAALGSQDPAIACALGRLGLPSKTIDQGCACLTSLRDWVFPACGGQSSDGRRLLR